tara:strand:- start:866 stop:1627 length:762 start_codon:yes stop_codon:yes gene_type:complete
MAEKSFKKRISNGDLLIGTFIKTPSYQIVELLSSCNIPFIVLDAEHAPFTKKDLDTCLLAAKPDTPVVVRVPSLAEHHALSVLDMGANAIIFPHINNKEDAERAVNISKYKSVEFKSGRRGFSNSSRSGQYGDVNINQMISSSNNSTSVICQIEEDKAVENINEIVNVNGVDCLFIGRADLAVTLGCDDISDKKINDAIDEVADAAKKEGISLGIYLPDSKSVKEWAEKGFSFFIVGSDQSHLKFSISQIINN